MQTEEYKYLFINSLYAIMFCSVIVCFGYFFLDAQIATFTHKHQLSHYLLFRWMTYIPDFLWSGAPLFMTYILIKRAYVQTSSLENNLFICSISLFITSGFVDFLKFCFGRYWPDTWVNNNPSLLQNDAYGFHPFHLGQVFQSFPSGHTAASVAILTVFWLKYPKWRIVLSVLYFIVPISLLCMNYHFFTDIIAGAVVGAIITNYCVRHSLSQEKSIP